MTDPLSIGLAVINVVAAVSGISARDLITKMTTAKAAREGQKLEKYRKDLAEYATPQKVREFVSGLYGGGMGPLRQVRIRAGAGSYLTSMFSRKEFLGTSFLPDDMMLTYDKTVGKAPLDVSATSAIEALAPRVLANLAIQGVKIWNSPTYRLLRIGDSHPLRATVGKVGFLEYRFGSGLVTDELAEALVDSKGDVATVLEERYTRCPIRVSILGDSHQLSDYSSRLCCGGVSGILAFARPAPHHDYYIPYMVRSNKVSENRGRIGLLPVGFHQPMVDGSQEMPLDLSLYREIYEELFGGSDAEQLGSHITPDWYLSQEPMSYFKEHENGFRCEVVSYGVNASTGNYEFGLLLYVPDTWFYKTYSGRFRSNWEPESIHWLSTTNTEKIAELIADPNWTDECRLALTHGLVRLASLDPHRVKLPVLATELV